MSEAAGMTSGLTGLSATMTVSHATIEPLGAFDLAQSIRFGFGQRDGSTDAVMRMAFVLDGYTDAVGVAVRQSDDASVQLEVHGDGDPTDAVLQAARVLSIDLDSSGWDELGRRDTLIGKLQRIKPGLRPPLFYSAYEAAAWSVLSARRPHRQMAKLRECMSIAYGTVLEVAGEQVAAFPTPEAMLRIREFAGLPEIKLRWLHGIARAALEGRLSTETLRREQPAEVERYLQTLDGIGPFYSQLISVRALGNTDVAPTNEPKLLGVLGRLCGLPGPVTDEQFQYLANRWAGWRTWASIAIRACGDELVVQRELARQS